jgi:hypothetical protein
VRAQTPFPFDDQIDRALLFSVQRVGGLHQIAQEPPSPQFPEDAGFGAFCSWRVRELAPGVHLRCGPLTDSQDLRPAEPDHTHELVLLASSLFVEYSASAFSPDTVLWAVTAT